MNALRSIAAFEFIKGVIVLLAAIGILFLTHRSPEDIADGLLQLLHISPDHHFAEAFLNWAETLTHTKLLAIAGVASLYSILRFLEAYGLWCARAWAEWIALISGALYLPFEVYEVIKRLSVFHIGLLTINLGIVFYMAYILKKRKNSLQKAT